MTSKTKHQHPVEIKINADFIQPEKAQQLPDTCAYVFSQGGRLLCCEKIIPEKPVVLKIARGKEPSSIRLLIGPTLVEDKINQAELLRRGAVNKMLRVDKNIQLDLPLYPGEWLCWLRSFCLVKGVMLKRTMVDGVPIDMPVCNAHVDIYEVDPLPLVIGRLSPEMLEKLRESLREKPPIDPIDPIGVPLPDIPQPPQPLPIFEGAKFALKSLTVNSNIEQFRNTLLSNAELIKPIIWPILCNFFNRPVTMQKVASAVTDDCGRFQTTYFVGCNNPDKPDLYFKATQKLFGLFDIIIYEPKPVNCFTHWNYACGSEVKLYTSSPWAKVCTPCAPVVAQNNWVLVRAIGNLPLSRIRGCSVALSATTNNDNIGLNMRLIDFTRATDDDPDNTFRESPFGGFLRLRIEFDNSIRESLSVKYYQVSFRRLESVTLNPLTEFLPLTAEIHRHFSYEIEHTPGDEGTHPDTHLVEEGFILGPQTVDGTPNLFEIPPALPEKGQWTFPDLTEDLINAKFPASLAPAAEAGKYQLKIDLFDENGVKVNIDNIDGQQIHYVVPRDADPSSSSALFTDEAAALNLIEVGEDGLKSFVMPLHIDNNECTAVVGLPELDGMSANSCGVINYQDQNANVNISFTALHPNGFANYAFTLKRGVTDLGGDVGQAGVATGDFINSNSVSQLLSADCPVAGFSAHLHVDAWATDGFGQIDAYDAGDHMGFALTPGDV